MRIRNRNTQTTFKPFVNYGHASTANQMREIQLQINQNLLLALQKCIPKPSNYQKEDTLHQTSVNNISSDYIRSHFNQNSFPTIQVNSPFKSGISELVKGLRLFSTSTLKAPEALIKDSSNKNNDLFIPYHITPSIINAQIILNKMIEFLPENSSVRKFILSNYLIY